MPAQHIEHGLSHHPLYKTWGAMRRRCNSVTCPRYPDYGGRGITVCKRWDNFALFLQDMGEKPEGSTLDRIDNSRGYSPDNCKWSTYTEQNSNRRFKLQGVHQEKGRSGWRAELKVNGNRVLCKRFKTRNEALAARKEAEIAYGR